MKTNHIQTLTQVTHGEEIDTGDTDTVGQGWRAE